MVFFIALGKFETTETVLTAVAIRDISALIYGETD